MPPRKDNHYVSFSRSEPTHDSEILNLLRKTLYRLGVPDDIHDIFTVVSYYLEDEVNVSIIMISLNSETFDPNKKINIQYEYLRGAIVDVVTGVILGRGLGYVREIITQSTINDLADGNLGFFTDKGADIPDMFEQNLAPGTYDDLSFMTISSDMVRLFVGYEGTILLIWKWHGKIFISTQNRLDGRRSNFGSSESFYDIFKRLVDPNFADMDDDLFEDVILSELFGLEKTSPYCHRFLVVHASVSLTSSVVEERLIYLPPYVSWPIEIFAREGGPYYEVEASTLEKVTLIEGGQIISHGDDDFDLQGGNVHSPVEMMGNVDAPFVYHKPFFIDGYESEDPSLLEVARFRKQKPNISGKEITTGFTNKILFPDAYALSVEEYDSILASKARDREMFFEYNESGNLLEVFYKTQRREIVEINDYRLMGGGFIMMEINGSYYSVRSPSYSFRFNIAGQDSSPFHAFVINSQKYITQTGVEELRQIASEAYMREGKPYSLIDGNVINKDEVRHLWLTVFVNAFNPDLREEVSGCLKRFHDELKSLADFIVNVYSKGKTSEISTNFNSKTLSRFDTILGYVNKKYPHSTQKDAKNIKKLVESYLDNETSDSLYKMFSEIRRYKKATH